MKANILLKPFLVPKFSVVDAFENEFSQKNLKDHWTVLYFYPKDMTPGCTTEANDFEKNKKAFAKLDCQIVGVSKDSCLRHQKFAEKEGLSFSLLSDDEGKMCEVFSTWVEKSLYGRKYMGIERSTFLIDPKGKVVAEWRKVKVPKHVDDVLQTLREIQKN